MDERSGSSERGDSPERDKALPHLELRRSAAKPAPSGTAREDVAAASHATQTPDEERQRRVAIYLIEREAIELRRQRWAPPPSPDERLAKYDRPKPPPAGGAPSVIRRVGSWLRSIFLGG